MDISVIIPVYNVRDFIGECLRSVMSQIIPDEMEVECLVVDDCGSDDSMAVAASIIGSYQGPITFRVINRNANGGLSAARNTGIRQAAGRYVYFLDSDDVITADCLTSLWGCVMKHPDVDIVTGASRSFPDEEAFSWMSLPLKEMPAFSDNRDWIRSIYLSKFPVIAWNKLISREFINNHSLFFREGIIHEDDHWRALTYPYVRSLGVVDRVTYLYRIREGSITNSKNRILRRIENLRKIYCEMADRKIEWDNNWADWFKALFYELYESITGEQECKAAHVAARNVAGNLWVNASVPLLLKLAFAYIAYMPTRRGREYFYKQACKLQFHQS